VIQVLHETTPKPVVFLDSFFLVALPRKIREVLRSRLEGVQHAGRRNGRRSPAPGIKTPVTMTFRPTSSFRLSRTQMATQRTRYATDHQRNQRMRLVRANISHRPHFPLQRILQQTLPYMLRNKMLTLFSPKSIGGRFAPNCMSTMKRCASLLNLQLCLNQIQKNSISLRRT